MGQLYFKNKLEKKRRFVVARGSTKEKELDEGSQKVQTFSYKINKQEQTFSCKINQFSSVQSLSHVQLCKPMNRSMPGLPVHHQLLESTQTHVHCVGDAIQLSHPLLSPSPPALNLSQPMSQVFASGGKKYWSFSFNISSSNEHPGLISFRMDWLDSPYSPSDSQASSLTPEFKSINSWHSASL